MATTGTLGALDHLAEEGVEEADGLGAGEGAVVEVAREDERVGPLGAEHRHHLVEGVALVVEQRGAVEDPPEVEVGEVGDAHRGRRDLYRGGQTPWRFEMLHHPPESGAPTLAEGAHAGPGMGV
jgi:hypothetical protein